MKSYALACECGETVTVTIADLPGAELSTRCPECGEWLSLTIPDDLPEILPQDAQPSPIPTNITHASTRENTSNE